MGYHVSFLIFIILFIKHVFRIGISNYYNFWYLNYLEQVPKLFGTDIIIIFFLKPNRNCYFISGESVQEPIPINS